MAKNTELTFLKSPAGAQRALVRLSRMLAKTPRDELSPGALWLEENMQQLLDSAEDIRIPLHFAYRLPRGEKDARILEAARALCWDQDAMLDEKRACLHLIAWQKQREWTLHELDFWPKALRIALMERVLEEARNCRREIRFARQAVFYVRMAEKGRMLPLPEEKALIDQIIRRLMERENMDALKWVDDVLKSRGLSAENVSRTVRESMTAAQQRLSRAIASLQQLGRVRFDAMTEKVSCVYQALRENPVFEQMDRESRAYYAACVRRMAREICVEEGAVARAAVHLAAGKIGHEGDTGYYLIERPDLIEKYLMIRKKDRFSLRHREGLFVCMLYASTALMTGLTLLWGASLWMLLPLMLCVSEGVRQFLYPLLRRLFPPRLLPRLQIKSIPEDKRVLVVVPTLITGRGHMLKMARHLSVLQCANGSSHIDYMLLGDFKDEDQQHLSGDEEIVLAAHSAFAALNEQIKGAPFLCIIRGRVWHEGQRKYMGWERKRGALNMLNRLIVQGETDDKIAWTNVETAKLKNRYAYVITLDADTFLPPGAVKKLLGAMLHPLQRGRIAVIQPRMDVGADTLRTRAQWHLGGRGGWDVYGGACQDVYQDLFGKGSFVGKGIYDPYLWCRNLEKKLPEGRLLSHDLIEGEYARSALAENVFFFDGHPARLLGFLKRQHRWTRGDWQLLPFLLRRDLSLISRHKIWDNLRRSLVPMAQVILFLLALRQKMPELMLIAFPWPLHECLLRLTLLPAFAWMHMDGIVRALWRQFVSHRRLLSWVTAAQTEGELGQPVPGMLFSIACGIGMIYQALLPGGFLPAVIVGILWVLSPLVGMWLDKPLQDAGKMREQDARMCKDLAAETWRFFDVWVNEGTHFLPPDNVQLSPDKGAAMRTSPTNIGLYLLSCAAAREMQLISGEEMGRRLCDTLHTLEKLPKWHGIPYNWYDLNTLGVLADDFVSSVDAGNLAACLLCTAQAARAHLKEFSPRHQSAPARLDRLFENMRLEDMYDQKAQLFFIGCDGKTGEKTQAHYDMLASEARLLSFAAIVKGQVSASHFHRLRRNLVRAGGGAALLSYGGTMFEYLLPQLMLPMYPGTLLRSGCLSAIRAQMAYMTDQPWGVSESGYAEFDAELNYQYRAFGVPALARSGETVGQVIAPYASALALPFFPEAAAENIRRMRALGWRSAFGLYEAADYTPARVESMPRLVESHMAHHQGMILCSLCNALTDFSLVRYLCRVPKVEAHLYLLMEKADRRLPARRSQIAVRTGGQDMVFMPRDAEDSDPADAHVLGFHGTSYVLDRFGQGMIKSGRCLWTRFDFRAGAQTGPQTYVWDDSHRVLLRPCRGKAQFDAGGVLFTLVENGLRITEKRFVAPLSGALIVHVTVENQSGRDREVEVTSFWDLALDTQQRAALNKDEDWSLAVTQADERVLLAKRRLLPGNEKVWPMLGHMAVGNCTALHAQGDRAAFLAGGDVVCPRSLLRMPLGRVGAVITPCFSFRMRLHVPENGCVQCAFVTAAAMNEEEMQRVLLPYADISKVREADMLSRTAAQTQMRALHMDDDKLRQYQHVLGAAFFAMQPHQTHDPMYARDALHRYGLTGEYPLITVLLGSQVDVPLIRHVLRAHAWFRLQGVWMDTALVYDRETGYQKPQHEWIQKIIQSSGARNWQGCPGGVHAFPLYPGEEQILCACSRLVLRGGIPLQKQLDALRTPDKSIERLHMQEGVTPDCGPLEMYNTCGGFCEDGAYQVISAPQNRWHHVQGNACFGTVVSNEGILSSRAGREKRYSVTSLRQNHAEELLLKTDQGIYSLTGGLASFEPGAAVYETECGGVFARTEVFVHPEMPVAFRRVTLRSSGDAHLSLSWRIHFSLGDQGEYTVCRRTEWGVTAENGAVQGAAWAKATESDVHLCGTDACFEHAWQLSSHESAVWEGCLGFGRQRNFADVPGGHVLRAVREYWQNRLGRMTVYMLDAAFDRMANVWLPYQVLTGEKDVLAALALVYTEPEWVKACILCCAAKQSGLKDGLDLVWAAAQYVRVTEDTAILDKKIGPLYLQEEEKAPRSLRDLCLDVIWACETGAHGLVCEKGYENTALTFWTVQAVRAFAAWCDEATAAALESKAESWLMSAQETWTGGWYPGGWNRDGRMISGPDTRSERIELAPQCLAVLAGVPSRQGKKALEYAWNRLYDGDLGIIRSMDPPMEEGDDAPAAALLPGLGENGGQVTLHAVWLAEALCALDEGERAWEVFRALLPAYHTDTEEKAKRYQLEPYVMAQYVHAGENANRGGGRWHALSAGEMYRLLIHHLLGFEKRGEKVTLRPQKGFAEREFTILYRYGQAVYHLTADQKCTCVMLDGKKQEDTYIRLSPEKGTHEARFPMRQ